MIQRSATLADKIIGERIRTARIAAGMSQSTMGLKLDVSFQQVQKYELGTNRVSAVRLALIAAFFKLPVTHFLEGIGDEIQPVHCIDPAMSILLTPQGRALALAFLAIDGEGRRSLLSVAEAIAGAQTLKAAREAA